MNLYVGNLSRDVSEDDLRQAFEAFGEVTSVNLVKDRFSGESRGFGFVMMSSQDEAKSAITEMNNKDLKGRNITVDEARPRVGGRRDSGRGGGFGGGRGGSGERGGNRSGPSRGGPGGGGGKRRY